MILDVSIIQFNPVWESPEENLVALGDLIPQAEGSLIVLPEMFATGFSMNAEKIAESEDGPIQRWMSAVAAATGKAIAGSVAVATGVRFVNRMIFATPDGQRKHYDKLHLFRMGGENEVYWPGDTKVIVEWGGFRFLLSLCYDLRFPVFLRNRGDYDVMINSANWPAVRRDPWFALLKARAIENVCYVIGANRVGDDPNARYCGDSVVFDFKGGALAGPVWPEQTILNTTLDSKALEAFRKKFPVHLDADEFEWVYFVHGK